jgi:processive 1,2-diacylglycerol beta-glucosyltransferase
MNQQTPDSNIPLYSVITDFSTHRLSLTSCVSGVFLSEKEEAAELQMVYPHCRFYPFGIPVKKVWEEQTEKQLIRKKLGISSGKPVLVVSGGGEGLTPEKKIKKLLQKDRQAWEVYLFGGKDHEKKPSRQIINGGSVLISKPFTPDYVDYVKAADLVISKPGGVSMAEAVSSNVQVGIISPLPGQEKENRRVLASYHGVHIIHRRTVLSDLLNKTDKRPVFRKGRGNPRKQIVQAMIGKEEVYTTAKAENMAEQFSNKYNDFPIG